MQGIINAFDMPGRQSFMVQMVEDRARPLERHRHQLVDGEHGAAGRPVARRHVDRGFQRGMVLPDRRHQLHCRHRLPADDAPPSAPVKRKATSTFADYEGGLDLRLGVPARAHHPLLFAVVSLMGMPFVVLMPIFAAQVLHGGPHTLGFLMGAMGVGALISALALAARKSVLRPGADDSRWPPPSLAWA